MKKSINAWAVDPETGFEEMFRQLHEAGFDGVELNVDAENHSAHSLTLSTTGEELRQLRALSKRYELPVVSISSSLYGGKMGSPDSVERAFTKTLLKKQLECAQALESGGILVVPGGGSPKISLVEDGRRSLETLLSLREEILKSGVYTGVENVWNGFFTSPFQMAEFIDRLDCPFVGVYFDVGNVVAFSWPEFWIEVLGERIHNVHIKDFKRRGGLNQGGAFVDLLLGDVNWKAVLPALRRTGFDGYLTAEVFREDSAVPEIPYEKFYSAVAKAMVRILEENEKEQ